MNRAMQQIRGIVLIERAPGTTKRKNEPGQACLRATPGRVRFTCCAFQECQKRPYFTTYLMNKISRYVGSGQRSSATMVSSLSATARTATIAGMTSDWKCLASASRSPPA